MGTEIRISVFTAVGAAFGASLAGTALFLSAGRQLKEKNDTGSELWRTKSKITAGIRGRTGKLWQAGMYAGNAAAAVLLTAVCQAGLFTVLKMLSLCTVLWVCAYTDCKAYLILNRVLLFGLLVFLAFFTIQGMLEPLNFRYAAMEAGIAAGGVFTAGLLCRLVMPGSVGFGDLKLLFLLGLYLGMDTWNAVFYTLLASFAVSVCLLAAKRVSKKSALPFAPFLLIGTLLELCF